MNRREFLLRTTGRDRHARELSCERLYMKYLDAQLDGTTPEFLQVIRRDLRAVRCVRLRDAFWLRQEEVKEEFDKIFEEFRSRGGTIEYL